MGWINFSPALGGVTIDADGNFEGWAWAENIGIHFNNPTVPYKVQTAGIPTPACVKVEDLAARAKSGKVQLTWTHVGADSYNVYRRIAGGGYGTDPLANTTSTYSTYLETAVTNGVTYYYRVAGVCNGSESAFSEEAGATPADERRRR